MSRFTYSALAIVALLCGCATSHQSPGWPRHRLLPAQITTLTPPNRDPFDASGLLLLPSGEMLTMRNNKDALLYRVEYIGDGAEARLVPFNDCFSSNQLAGIDPARPKGFDGEGIARDDQGRFYLCEERRRWILRCDPSSGKTERLAIDWGKSADYFSSVDPNASFEGIAVGKGRLYVANERNSPRIIVVDLATLKVTKDFLVEPTKASFFGLHYSDLCWFEDELWVLCRQHRVVLRVDPDKRRVLAEFDYGDLEESLGYRTGLPVGIMEGLAVSKDSIWLVTDNNGDPRGREGNDIRPALVRCARPDR
jgi:hypothetical protein